MDRRLLEASSDLVPCICASDSVTPNSGRVGERFGKEFRFELG